MRPLFPDHAGISPTTQTDVISLQKYSSFAGETIGTHIEEYRSLLMPLRLRGGYATECHAFSYYAHKAHVRRKQANKGRSQKDESAVFVVWEEEHKEPKRTTATSCGWSNGACVRRKFGTHRLAALRLGFRLRKSRYRV